MRLGKIRFSTDRLAEQADRVVEPALPDPDQPEVEQRSNMVGIAFQNGSIKRLRFRQAALLLQRQRVAEIPRAPSRGLEAAEQARYWGSAGDHWVVVGCAGKALLSVRGTTANCGSTDHGPSGLAGLIMPIGW